ncbi:MAG: hypothetical protein ACXVB6_10255 [Mucilaginibacter sp.]
MNWTALVLIICCSLTAFAVWKEYKRAKKAHMVWRIAASLLAVFALACIALPINYSKDSLRQNDQNAILLTNGFEPDSLNNYRDSKIFTTDKAIEKAYPKAKPIRLDELSSDSPAVTKLHVFGYGLNENELSQIGRLPVIFHPALSPAGVVAIGWNQKLKTGETLKVQGKYNNNELKPVKLILNGLNTQLDTVTVAPKTSKDFELTTVPKNEGRAVYRLQAIAGSDTLADENLPIEVDPAKPLKVLILSASPDFETKFLKNWLAENGFAVVVRSAISKDKFSSEYVNMPMLKIDHISSGILDKFDVVIGDLSVLKSENAVLKQQVTKKGLGVIVRADSISNSGSWLQSDFSVEKVAAKNQPQVSLIIKGKAGKSAGLKIDPAFIKSKPGIQQLVNDLQGHTLVAASLFGKGRLAFTTINNTFNWILAGDKDDYAAFWSLLISKSAQKEPVLENWSAPQLPTINEPVELQLVASSDPGPISAGDSIAPAQNPSIPFEWVNKYWPTTTGWQSIQQNNGRAAWWYVYGGDEWQGVRASEKIASTTQYAENYAPNTFVTKAIHEKVLIAVPKIYFYLLLLAACTFLWVEGKLAN